MTAINTAFSGSGFKFPAHVGALAALLKAGLVPDEVAGTSGGSIVAALYACGHSIDNMVQMTMTQNWSSMLRPTPMAWPSISWCDGENLLNWLLQMTEEKTFIELDHDLTVIASDVKAEKPFEFSRYATPHALVAEAVRASTSIPFVYEPYVYEGIQLADGGLCNNIPIDRLTHSNPRLGIQLVANDTSPLTLLNRPMHLLNMMMNASEAAHIDIAALEGAQVAFIETGYASSLDRNMKASTRSRLFNAGGMAVQSFIGSIK